MNILNIEHIHKIFGDKVIFDDISCGIDREKRSESSVSTEQEKPPCSGSLQEKKNRMKAR